VRFFTLYIEEAHPTDGWNLTVNKNEGISFKKPTSLAQRVELAKYFMDISNHAIPVLVDSIDNAVCLRFSAAPERLYVIRQGKVIFKGEPGPWGYDLDALERFLEGL